MTPGKRRDGVGADVERRWTPSRRGPGTAGSRPGRDRCLIHAGTACLDANHRLLRRTKKPERTGVSLDPSSERLRVSQEEKVPAESSCFNKAQQRPPVSETSSGLGDVLHVVSVCASPLWDSDQDASGSIPRGRSRLSADFQTRGINSCFSVNESWKIQFAFPADSYLLGGKLAVSQVDSHFRKTRLTTQSERQALG